MVVFVSSSFPIGKATIFTYYSCHKITKFEADLKIRFKFHAKIKLFFYICIYKILEPLVSRSKTKWCKHQKTKGNTLISQLKTYQILRNVDQMFNLCLSYFITTVISQL